MQPFASSARPGGLRAPAQLQSCFRGPLNASLHAPRTQQTTQHERRATIVKSLSRLGSQQTLNLWSFSETSHILAAYGHRPNFEQR